MSFAHPATHSVLGAVGMFTFGYTPVLATQAVLRGACGTAELTAGSSTTVTDTPSTPHVRFCTTWVPALGVTTVLTAQAVSIGEGGAVFDFTRLSIVASVCTTQPHALCSLGAAR